MPALKRRDALIRIAALYAAFGGRHSLAQAMPPKKRIAFLGVAPGNAPTTLRTLAAFREGLVGEGLVEERDFTIDYTSEPRIDRVRGKVTDLLKGNPSLLVAITTPVAQAAAKATRQIPIVFGVVSDPVGSGLVESLARPGGNVTGVSNMLPALSGKLLELVRELLPSTSRVAMLWNPDNPAKEIEAEELRAAARKLNLGLAEFPARTLAEIEGVLARGAKQRPTVLVILAETLTDANRKRIAELALVGRIAVVSNLASHTEAGGLLSYQPDYAAHSRRVGALAGKILKGAAPADLPVELPAKFELLVNKGAAKVLGIAIPPSILLRADRVIE